MKIIITGATGFVGSHLVRHYGKLGHKVIAIGRQSYPPEPLNKYATWQKLDLKDNYFPPMDADILIHAAGLTSDRGSYQSFYENNVEPTVKLYNQFRGKHFVFISSSSVYPFINKTLKEEDGVMYNDLSHYGRSKLEAEGLLFKNRKPNKKITILRPRSVYGTNDRILLPKILKLYKKKILLIGSMDVSMSMTHIDNLIKAVDASFNIQKSDFELFNVADKEAYNLREVIISLCNRLADKEMGVIKLPLYFISCLTKLTAALNVPFVLTPQSLDYLSRSCILDTSKIEEHLRVEFEHNFDQELDALVSWINKVGLPKVKSGDANLPWLGV